MVILDGRLAKAEKCGVILEGRTGPFVERLQFGRDFDLPGR